MAAAILTFWSETVLYECSCRLASPFSQLYFCRYCVQPRCQKCVYHEIDSYFCSNCLENMPSAEAKLKKNRCANCYECPSCGNTLSTRATAVAVSSENPEEKGTAKKVFYLACGFCRWSTRDVGIADKTNASGGWPELENPLSKRVNTLIEYYKKLALREKYEREKIKLKKKSYIHISNKPSNLGLLKKRSSLSLLKSLTLTKGDSFEEDAVLENPSEATEEPARQSLYTEVIQLEKAASISQMLAQPEYQHHQTSDFYPKHKHLVAKRSQRCRQCEHNLCKPEFNPGSTKYKIQFFAINYIPQLQIADVPELVANKKVRVILSLRNPMDYPINVMLKQVEGVENSQVDTVEGGLCEEKPINESEMTDGNKKLTTSITDDAAINKLVKIPVDNSSDNEPFEVTAQVNLPAIPLQLAAKDDAAEFDETESAVAKYNDDPNVISSRQANKIWFYLDVTPLGSGGNVKFSLNLEYDFKTIPSSLGRVGNDEIEESKTIQLKQTVYVNLGKISH